MWEQLVTCDHRHDRVAAGWGIFSKICLTPRMVAARIAVMSGAPSRSRLMTMAQIAAQSGKSERTIRLYQQHNLVCGFERSRSLGRHRGRVVLYDGPRILSELGVVEGDLAAGVSLEQQSQQRGWYFHGATTFSHERRLDGIASEVLGEVKDHDRRQFLRAVRLAAELGAFSGEPYDSCWKVFSSNDGPMVRFYGTDDEKRLVPILEGMKATMKGGTVDAAVLFALAMKESELARYSEADCPEEDAEKGAVVQARIEARRRRVERQINLWETVMESCRTRGTAFRFSPGGRSQGGSDGDE